MTEESFLSGKEILVKSILDRLSSATIGSEEHKLVNMVLGVARGLTFENRMRNKGLLTHIVIDSFPWGDPLGLKLKQFDDKL